MLHKQMCSGGIIVNLSQGGEFLKNVVNNKSLAYVALHETALPLD